MCVPSICKTVLDSSLLNVNHNLVKYIYISLIGYDKMEKEICGVGLRTIAVYEEVMLILCTFINSNQFFFNCNQF